MIDAFIQGFTHAIKESPKAFFAPAIAVWRILFNVTESMIKHPNHQKIS